MLIAGGDWTPRRVEFLYELAYLRLFAEWESVLESIFVRSLCGFASRSGQETLCRGSYFSTLDLAETAMFAAESRGGHTKTFLLWHNSLQIINRCRLHIRPRSATIPGIQESIISSNQARLDAFSAIRHRIVHNQKDAKPKFDQATLLLVGRTYPASRPGKFLREDEARHALPRKWFEGISTELVNLASQMI